MVYIYLVILFILIILIYKYYHTQNIVFVTYGNEKFKPGFEDQIKAFMSFIKKNNKISNDIFFAENVMKICKKIL